MIADPRPAARVHDPQLLRALHNLWRGSCVLADDSCEAGFSLHHLSKHPRDDLVANLVMLCGDGTRGHHGRIEHHHAQTIAELRAYLHARRPDAVAYLQERRHSLGYEP